jgi:hypothetical protein
MADQKSDLELKSKRMFPRAFASPAVEATPQVIELLQEIDNLALLLDKVRRQSDHIQAVADAIGDSVIEAVRSDALQVINRPHKSATPASRTKLVLLSKAVPSREQSPLREAERSRPRNQSPHL